MWTQGVWIGSIALLCIVFGLAKILKPKYFLELRQKYRWLNALDIYAFVFKSKYAEKVVLINGYLLLAIGIGLAIWVALKTI